MMEIARESKIIEKQFMRCVLSVRLACIHAWLNLCLHTRSTHTIILCMHARGVFTPVCAAW